MLTDLRQTLPLPELGSAHPGAEDRVGKPCIPLAQGGGANTESGREGGTSKGDMDLESEVRGYDPTTGNALATYTVVGCSK